MSTLKLVVLLPIVGFIIFCAFYRHDYTYQNFLASELTTDARHPQHISHLRYAIRINKVTGHKCILKVLEPKKSKKSLNLKTAARHKVVGIA